jgi:hypothetical protein
VAPDSISASATSSARRRGRAGSERLLRVLSGQHEGLAGEGFGPREQFLVGNGHGSNGR